MCGITQKELATALNVSQNAVFNWENGKREPNLDTIEKIAEALQVPITKLIGIDNLDTKFSLENRFNLSAYDGVKAILKHIYGDIVEKNVFGAVYYLIEMDTESFIIYPEDVEKLLNYAKASFPLLVNELKDTRSEKEIFAEIIEHLKRIGEYNEPPAE